MSSRLGFGHRGQQSGGFVEAGLEGNCGGLIDKLEYSNILVTTTGKRPAGNPTGQGDQSWQTSRKPPG